MPKPKIVRTHEGELQPHLGANWEAMAQTAARQG